MIKNKTALDNGITNIHMSPLANRRQIAIFGATNAGKSTLFNHILGQEMSIVSEQHGTTTDPVVKSMELLDYGPIALIDTAGLNDKSELGQARIKRSRQFLGRCDAALYVADAPVWFEKIKNQEILKKSFDNEMIEKDYQQLCSEFEKYDIPHLLLLNKADLLSKDAKKLLEQKFPQALFIGYGIPAESDYIYSALRKLLDKSDSLLTQTITDTQNTDTFSFQKSESAIAGLIKEGETVLMVVPVDSEAPKGRLILPQVQLIRDCLDNGIRCLVCRDIELAQTINDYKDSGINLVVTDSQAFAEVAATVPQNIPLTSFSMLLAAQKGDFDQMVKGVKKIAELKGGDYILISESCTHNTSHEDIGRVKIPALLKKITGLEFDFEFCAGQAYPSDLSKYSLIIHCGGCMITHRTMLNRIKTAGQQNIPITNYGLVLAYGNNILERSTEIFRQK